MSKYRNLNSSWTSLLSKSKCLDRRTAFSKTWWFFCFIAWRGGGGGLLNGCCILRNFVPGDSPMLALKKEKNFHYHSIRSRPPLIIIPGRQSNSVDFLRVTGIVRCFMNTLPVTAHMGLKDGVLFDNDKIPVALCLNRKQLYSKMKIIAS